MSTPLKPLIHSDVRVFAWTQDPQKDQDTLCAPKVLLPPSSSFPSSLFPNTNPYSHIPLFLVYYYYYYIFNQTQRCFRAYSWLRAQEIIWDA